MHCAGKHHEPTGMERFLFRKRPTSSNRRRRLRNLLAADISNGFGWRFQLAPQHPRRRHAGGRCLNLLAGRLGTCIRNVLERSAIGGDDRGNLRILQHAVNTPSEIFYYVYGTKGYGAFLNVTAGNNRFAGDPTYYSAHAGFNNVSGIGVPLGMPVAQTVCPNRVPLSLRRATQGAVSLSTQAPAEPTL